MLDVSHQIEIRFDCTQICHGNLLLNQALRSVFFRNKPVIRFNEAEVCIVPRFPGANSVQTCQTMTVPWCREGWAANCHATWLAIFWDRRHQNHSKPKFLIWGFPKIGVPPKLSIFMGFSTTFTNHCGDKPGQTPMCRTPRYIGGSQIFP